MSDMLTPSQRRIGRRLGRLLAQRAALRAQILVAKSAITHEAHRLGLTYADLIRLAHEESA
jgi:hypothetical protein